MSPFLLAKLGGPTIAFLRKANVYADRTESFGIDVGGTFTKAEAIDVKSGQILAKSTVHTTHSAEKGVSEGIVKALSNILKESEIKLDEIELISHSTTQAINALLESDTYKVGIIAMGVGPTKGDVMKRTTLNDKKNQFPKRSKDMS